MSRRLRKEVADLKAQRRRRGPEDEPEALLEEVRQSARRANERHLRTVARVRRMELIREHGGSEGLDLSEGAVLDGGEEVPFAIGKDGSVACSRDGRPATDTLRVWAEESWWLEAGWLALTLVEASEPPFTLHEDGVLRTTDGRDVLSRDRHDLAAHCGPQTSRQHEAMIEHPERWERLLDEDDAAASALDRLLAIPEDLDAPDGFVTPISDAYTEEEAESFAGTMKPHGLFRAARQREDVRRLAWALLHDPEARAALSDLTRRRDAFAAEEGEDGP
jgi:hypothetical protein